MRFGRTWMKGFQHHPHCRLTTLCDIDTAALEKGKAESGVDTVASRLEEVLDDRHVDAIALFTPAPLHAEQSAAALRAGKHVLSAVPAAVTEEGYWSGLSSSTSTTWVEATCTWSRRCHINPCESVSVERCDIHRNRIRSSLEHVFSDEGFDVIRVEVRGDSVELSTVLCHSTQTDQYGPFARIVILCLSRISPGVRGCRCISPRVRERKCC